MSERVSEGDGIKKFVLTTVLIPVVSIYFSLSHVMLGELQLHQYKAHNLPTACHGQITVYKQIAKLSNDKYRSRQSTLHEVSFFYIYISPFTV